MAFASSGSASSWISNCAWSACRNSAFSSSETLPSSASSLSPASRASGLTSTSVASSSTKTFHSACTSATAWSASSAGERRPRSTIARALASSTPVPASIGIFLTASGLVLATSSISTPPSTLAMQRYGAVGAVEQEGEVVLLLDAARRRDQHPVDREALDLHAEDLPTRARSASSGVLASLTPPALPRPPALTCALTTTDAADLLGGGPAPRRRVSTVAERHRYAVLGEELLRLVLHQVHEGCPCPQVRWSRSGCLRTPPPGTLVPRRGVTRGGRPT